MRNKNAAKTQVNFTWLFQVQSFPLLFTTQGMICKGRSLYHCCTYYYFCSPGPDWNFLLKWTTKRKNIIQLIPELSSHLPRCKPLIHQIRKIVMIYALHLNGKIIIIMMMMMMMMMMMINCCYQQLGLSEPNISLPQAFFSSPWRFRGSLEIQRFHLKPNTKNNSHTYKLSMYFIYFHVLHYPSTVLSHNVQH